VENFRSLRKWAFLLLIVLNLHLLAAWQLSKCFDLGLEVVGCIGGRHLGESLAHKKLSAVGFYSPTGQLTGVRIVPNWDIKSLRSIKSPYI